MVFQDPYHEIYQDSLVITLSEAVTPRLQLFSCCREVYQIATLFANISPYDERVPSGICDSCRNVLREKIKGKGQKKELIQHSN